MADDIPEVLAGRYEVRDLIGRGGMAEVHIGYDRRLSRTVAIKVLRSDLARDPTFQARFRREAQAAASLNHPAIVSVYDTGEDEVVTASGKTAHVPFIVMEYVEGHTVRSLLSDETPVPIDEAVEIVTGVLTALEYSHREGIVHRDIKPGNVMLTPTGQVKVMDFGIARAMADSAATMTQTHAVVGTAQYLSPEQARGEIVDSRSDIYSTGCLLYELLTGKPPFTGDSPVAIAYQHVRETPKPPSAVAEDIPEALDRIVLKALAKDRVERYPDAAAMRLDLAAAARGGRVTAPAVTAWATSQADPTSVLTQAQPGIGDNPVDAALDADPEDVEDEDRRSPWWVWALVLVGVIALAGIAYLLVTGDNEAEETPTEEPSTPTQVEVPDLEGQDEDGVTASLETAGLVPDFQQPEASDEVAEGEFLRSDPSAGELVDEGSTVQIWLSAGPDSVEVPSLDGLTQERARERLQEEGLRVGNVRTEDDPSQPADRVLRSEPEAGTSVAPNSEVTLYIASGNVTVPDLQGMTRDEAEAALNEVNLGITLLERPTGDFEPDLVVDWEPQGTQPQRTLIRVYYAVEPATPDPPTPNEDPTTEEPTDDDGDDEEEPTGDNDASAGFGRRP